jgi:hypothetical protein
MGFGSWIKKAVKKVKKAVKAVVNAVEEVVSDVVEGIGNAIEDGLGWLGDRVPWVGGAFKWLGAVVSSVTDFVAAVVKGVVAIVAGVVGGLVTMLVGVFVGIFTGDWSVLGDGFRQLVSGIVGGGLLILGKLVAVVQSVFHLQAFERTLTDIETEMVRRVFAESIALYNVRLIEGWAGLYSLNSRPFTLGNTIYLKSVDTSSEPEILIHECVHVWQYQNNGASYIGGALGAQAFIPDEYNWERDIARGNLNWVDFNKEAQGKFLEDLWTDGSLIEATVTRERDGVFFFADGKGKIGHFDFEIHSPIANDYTKEANDAVKEVRGAKSVRLSASWS